MRKTAALIALATVTLQACVVAPRQPVPVVVQPQPGVVHAPPVVVQQAPGVVVAPPGVVVPPGVVYVAPTYPAPAVGFVWEFHPRFGWGWRHPVHGWHRGWR